jgi:hypothetical protein
LDVRIYLQTLDTIPISLQVSEGGKSYKPASFRVYLGAFHDVISDGQSRILSDWDVVIRDPLQPGVSNAITSTPWSKQIARFVLGKLDF